MDWFNPEGCCVMPIPAPISLRGGGSGISEVINSDTVIGNLWTFLGSPSGPREVIFIVDGADAQNILVTNDWHPSSTFQFNLINSGRIVGVGGDGGAGGDDNGATGTSGTNGGAGGTALSTQDFNLNIDLDDGFLFAGGGGGGGSSADDLGATTDAGGGGGGGQGSLTGGSGGAAGGGGGASAGTAGTKSAPGVGGAGAGGGPADGGNGGTWGVAGDIAYSDSVPNLRSGLGGQAGLAFASATGNTLTYTGSKSKATLITEGRIKGQIGPGYVNMPIFVLPLFQTDPAPFTMSWSFLTNGTLQGFDSIGGTSDFTEYWRQDESGGTPGNDYEVQGMSAHISFDVWDATPGAPDTWFALTSFKAWSITDSTFQTVTQLFQIRDAVTLDVVSMGWLQVEMENL